MEVGTRLDAWMTQANSYRALGEVHLLQGYPDRAAELFDRAGVLYEQAAARGFANLPHEGLAQAHTMRGWCAEAVSEARQALETAEESGNLKGVCDARNVLGEALNGLEEHVEALRQHTEALRIAEETSYPWGICAARKGMAQAYRTAQRLDEAMASASLAHDSARSYRLRIAEVDVLVLLGRLHLEKGAEREAGECARRAVELSAVTGQRLVHARALQLVGDVEGAPGKWREALELFAEIGAPEAHPLRSLLG